MHLRSSALTVIVSAVTAVAAIPFEGLRHDGVAASVPVQSRGLRFSAAKDVKRVREKYAFMLRPRSISGRAAVPATADPQDIDYHIPVSIGSKSYTLLLDTSSADTWISSKIFTGPGNATCTVIPHYSWGSEFGPNEAHGGVMCTDKVSIGSAVAASQAIGVASWINPDITANSHADGLIGLAPTGLTSTARPKAQLSWVSSAGVKSFSLDLKRGGGTMAFHNTPPVTYDGKQVSYTPLFNLEQWGYWIVNASAGYTIGSKHYTANNAAGAILDTGTTLLYLGNDVVKSYYAGVKNATFDGSQGLYVFPCKQQASLPIFKISIGNSLVTVPREVMNFGSIEPGSDSCVGALQPNEGVDIPDIYGATFFKAVYAVFDASNKQFGFAQK